MPSANGARRIVVTGLGAVTPLATGVEASWSRRSGIWRLPDRVVEDLPAKVGGVAPPAEEDQEVGFDAGAVMAPKDQRKVDRYVLIALVVVATVLMAATDSVPKRRYAAGKLARQVSRLRRFVPASAFVKSLRKQLDLPV